MRLIISIAHHKGGVTKTTIATNLATALRRKGHKIKVLDLDLTNQSASDFFDNRDDVDCILIETKQDFIDELDYDGIIICDIAGFDSELTAGVINASDKLIVPFNPDSDKDYGGLINFMLFIKQLESLEEGTDLSKDKNFVLTMIHPRVKDISRFDDEITPLLEHGYKIAGRISRLKSYEKSGKTNQDVYEYGCITAASEIKEIIKNIGL